MLSSLLNGFGFTIRGDALLEYKEVELEVNGEARLPSQEYADLIAKRWKDEYDKYKYVTLYGVRPISGRPGWYETYIIERRNI